VDLGVSVPTLRITRKLSRRWVAGTKLMTGTGATTAEAVAEHSGHRCELEGSEVRSAQKWNCAPRKTIPSNNAKIGMRSEVRGM
jgi:hypothetical protein